MQILINEWQQWTPFAKFLFPLSLLAIAILVFNDFIE